MAIRMSGLASGMDTDSMVKELMKAENLKKQKIDDKITMTQWKQDKWKDLNTKIYSFYTGPLAKLRMQGSFLTKKVSSSNDSKASAVSTASAPVGNNTLKIKQLASSQFVTGDVLGTDINSKVITSNTKLVDLGIDADPANSISISGTASPNPLVITDTTTVGDLTNLMKSAGLNATFDTVQKRFFISSKDSGSANAFSISASGTVDLTQLGLSEITKTDNGDGTFTVAGGPNITLVPPTDAKFILNGANITSSSNNVSVNGLTITLKSVTNGLDTPDPTDDEVINIGVQNDAQSVYDMVKDFVKNYDLLITEMNVDYNAASASGYSPLTDDQKAAMTDTQITQWETKIQDSLLRRDDNLGSLTDTLRSIANTSVDVNGKKYSLSSFGINSVSYTEKGLLHIQGDKDDSVSSGYSDKLMKALTDDPDTVMKVINKVADGLYSTLTDKMKSTSLRSALTVYNDKEMTKQITDYKADLKTMEDKLQATEDRYYKQFSAMETAMSKMNSQSSQLTSMLGSK